MTAADEIKALPLPPTVMLDRHIPTGVSIYGYTAAQMRDLIDAAAAIAARQDAVLEQMVEKFSALLDKLPKPEGHGYPTYFAKAELEAARRALDAALRAHKEME